jgi:3-phenylpropionate/cinnamic acid dioxygenase small subunit
MAAERAAARVSGLARLSDGLAIRDLLYRYARGIDRRDLALVRSCFAADARYEGALAAGTIADMLAALPDAMSRYVATMHFMGEPVVVIDGGRARSETRTLAYHVLHDPPRRLRTVGVRYDDLLERRDDGWRIVARRVHRCWEELNDRLPPRSAP